MTAGALKARVAAGAFWVSVDTWSGQLAQVATFLVLSRLLGPHDYGVMGMALIVTVGAEVLVSAGGWDDAIGRLKQFTPAHEASVFWFLLAASAVLALAVSALAPPAAWFFDTPALGSLLPWLSLQLPLSALSVVPRARLRRELRFAPLAVRGMVSQAMAGALAVALALTGSGIWSLVVYQIVQPAVDAAVIWSAARWRPHLVFSRPALRQVLPFVGYSLADRLIVLGDNLLQRSWVGLALGTVALGLFTFARKIVELLLQAITRPISKVLLPSAATLRDQPERLAGLVAGAAQLAGLLIFPAATGVAMVAPELVPMIVGPAWTDAVSPLQMLMVVAALAPFAQIASSLNNLAGQAVLEARLSAVSALFVSCLLLALGRGSLQGVVAALMARTAFMLPLRFATVRYTTGLDLFRLCRPALAPLMAALVMVAALCAVRLVWPPDLSSAARLGLVVVIGCLVYGAAVLLLAKPALLAALDLVRSLGTRRRQKRA